MLDTLLAATSAALPHVPASADFAAGFMVATALLHGLGYLGGRSLARRWHWLSPVLGGGMSLFGLVLLMG